MDKLTILVIQYKKSRKKQKKNNLIQQIQCIVYPIIKSIFNKWSIYNLPKYLTEKIFNDAKTIELLEAIKIFKKDKRSKFSSIYATRLNFLFRVYHRRYFQNGKIVKRRHGELNLLSLDYTYSQDNSKLDDGACSSLLDLIPLKQHEDIRWTAEQKLINEALNILTENERKIINVIFFDNNSISKATKILKLSPFIIRKELSSSFDKLKKVLTI